MALAVAMTAREHAQPAAHRDGWLLLLVGRRRPRRHQPHPPPRLGATLDPHPHPHPNPDTGTNRADILDAALPAPGPLRPRVVVDRPDIKGRSEIFGVHLKALTLGDGDADEYAKKLAAPRRATRAPRWQRVQQAALIAARLKARIDGECFDAAIDRVIAGLEKKGLVIDAHVRHALDPDPDLALACTLAPRDFPDPLRSPPARSGASSPSTRLAMLSPAGCSSMPTL